MGKQMKWGNLRRWAAALVVLFALRAAPVRADGAAAEVLIQQGLKLRREGKPEEALQRFREAHDMTPSPRTYGQMGLVEATLKHWTDGETHLAVALANPDDAWVRKNRAFLDQALSLCREHVGDLVITGPAGAEVSVGGTPAGTLPAVPALRVAEGTVEVTATASGYEPFKTTVNIRAGKRSALRIAMSPEPVAAGHADAPPKAASLAAEPDAKPQEPEPKIGSSPPPTDDGSHWHTWAGITLGAVGAGAVAFGIYLMAVDGGCKTLDGTTRKCMDYYYTKTDGWIVAGLGAAALVVGGIVFFTGPSGGGSPVSLGASPNGLWVAGRF
ncbi:MAG: PEGA domain-containing protein [Pseudomonadota bacterium]